MTVLEMTVSDGIAVLRLNRPEKHNAINPEMMVRLADAWTTVRDDEAIRVAVLTGTGSEAFCTGGDLRSLIPLLTRARPPEDHWDERLLADQRNLLNTALLRTTEFPKPIIAAVNGLCFAGGMELTLATDLRVSAQRARFALSEVQRGLIPGGGSVARLPRQVAAAVAMEFLIVGEPVSSRRAYEIGLLNTVVPDGEEFPAAMAMAARVANNAPLAVRAIKRVCAASAGMPLDDAFHMEDEAAREIMRSRDAREGAKAFTERRPPNFSGT